MKLVLKTICIISAFFSMNWVLGQDTYRDNFSTVSYSRNDGTQNFSTDWLENGQDTNNGPTAQYIRVTGNRLELYWIYGETIRRSANLTGSNTATLSFNWQSLNLSGTRALDVQVSSDGGANYSSVGTITGNTNGFFSQDISSFISANTTIRFAKTNTNWNNNQYAYIDNFQIRTTPLALSPVMEINDVTVNESAGNVSFTVTHTGANASGPFTINYQTSDGLATAGLDYTSSSGTLNFNGTSGQSRTVTVPILEDALIESTETFSLQIVSANNPNVVFTDIGTASIFDNDSITMTNGVTSNECDKLFLDPGGLGNYGNNLDVTHTLCPEPGKDYVSVDFSSFDIDAGGDYLYVYNGSSTAAPLIGRYDNDNIPNTIASSVGSGCLTFRFTSNNSGTGSGFSADINCYNEGPRLVVDDVSIDEDGGNMVFTVTSTRAAHGRNVFLLGFVNTQFTVDYTTTNGSALSGSDYTTTTGTLTFSGAIGNQRTISVPIINDGVPEFDEDFFIEFTGVNAPDAQVNFDDTGKGTINSQILSNVPLALFKQFDGDYDYVSTGGSLRTASNGTNSCSIQASSTNQLVSGIPATGTIKAAYLYWAHSSYVRDEQVTFEGQTVDASSVYQTTFNLGGNNLSFFGYVSDVTQLVSGIPNINTNNFDFSDLTIDTSNNFCSTSTVLGGWSLFVYYEDPNLPAVSINLYQGFDGLRNNSPGTPFTLDSFYAIAGSGAKATFLSWEGDDTLGSSGANPERLTITNEVNSTFTLSGDGGQTGNNAYNGTIFDNTIIPTPYNQTNVYGLDLDTYDISTFIAPGDSQVTATVNVGADYVINMAVVMKVPSNLITGTVFEDVNYPGGLGRNQAAASGLGVSGAIVELFESNGTFIERKLTNTDGQYTFAGMEDGSYLIKVVNSSVRSTRTGGLNCSECFPVQTYRSFGDANTITEVLNEIGGANPSATQDAALGILLNAQTVSSTTVASNGVTNINFGFNFNTIVNTNASGQGSLNQFIVNSNTLGETALDIEANAIFDPAPEEDTSIFMIPPTSDSLGRTADANYSNGVFNILISNGTPLTTITGTNTVLDGRTQTAYSGDSNIGAIGAGGTLVGTSGTALPNYSLPEIQLHKNNGNVLQTTGTNVVIRNTAIYAGINSGLIVNGGTATILNSLIGVNALGANSGAITYGVEINDGEATIDSNYISTNTNAGIWIKGGSATLVQNNQISANGNTSCGDNITISGGSGIVVHQNLIENAASLGIDGDGIVGGVTITENTITGAGQNGTACNGNIQNAGIKLDGNNSSVVHNVIFSNGGPGLVFAGGSTFGNLISQNSFYANGTAANALGIDLDGSDGMGDGVTLNDNGDTDNGPNGLTNFPLITGAYVAGSNFVVEGWSRPGATIEWFLTDITEGTATAGDNQLGLVTDYGEGQTYIGTGIEGSGADTDSRVGNYIDLDGNTDNTNKFKFIIPKPAGVNLSNLLTATATISNTTSEFSPISQVKTFTVITNRRITYRVKEN